MKNLLTSILLLLFISVQGQDIFCSISGIVKDTSGEPLPFASVLIESSKLGVLTDDNGYFTINKIPKGKHNVIISFVGYTTRSKTFEFKENTSV